MNWQKGFSLTEVLVSLLLVTTLALTLLQQRGQSIQLLNQLVLRMQASQFLDQIEETLVAQVPKLPSVPTPYHLEIQHKNQHVLIQLDWFQQLGVLTRKRSSTGNLK
ncbi:prepilin-type N-terminal cleavage/methylation domain-containing protein [Legionella sp. 227]|uniref:prepilin-type N-terminal cleavage/methylation domain-containing protein n=1 Tax=Legionella sp. 227 TaxID=3367288 RepID=UPI00370D0323